MKKSMQLAICNFVKFVPISYLHEVTLNIPITYDKDQFQNALSKKVMNFLKKHVDVRKIVRIPEGGLDIELKSH